MEKLKQLKKGDKVSIKNINQLVREYIFDNLFKGMGSRGLEEDVIRAYASLLESKKYRVTSNCISCKFLYIDIKGRSLQIRYKFVDA